MRRWIGGAIVLVGTALLWGCDGQESLTDDAVSLCPGSRNCPAEDDYVGMLFKESAFVSSDSASVAFAGFAVGSGTAAAGGAAPQGAEPQGTSPAGLNSGRKVCPQRSASCAGPLAGQSGLVWTTPQGEQGRPSPQINCVPSAVCVIKNGRPIQAEDGKGGRMFMERGYSGWLCRKSSGKCGDLPQAPS